MGLSVPTSLVLDLFGTGIGDDSFRCFCIKGFHPVVSAWKSSAFPKNVPASSPGSIGTLDLDGSAKIVKRGQSVSPCEIGCPE